MAMKAHIVALVFIGVIAFCASAGSASRQRFTGEYRAVNHALDKEKLITFTIYLKQRNLELLTTKVNEVHIFIDIVTYK